MALISFIFISFSRDLTVNHTVCFLVKKPQFPALPYQIRPQAQGFFYTLFKPPPPYILVVP
jgi:hypothetical protein